MELTKWIPSWQAGAEKMHSLCKHLFKSALNDVKVEFHSKAVSTSNSFGDWFKAWRYIERISGKLTY